MFALGISEKEQHTVTQVYTAEHTPLSQTRTSPFNGLKLKLWEKDFKGNYIETLTCTLTLHAFNQVTNLICIAFLKTELQSGSPNVIVSVLYLNVHTC